MTTQTQTERAQGRAKENGAATRNVHQRKLAVMAKCDALTPDKTHAAHNFRYLSIQTISNHLRRFMADEGLDFVASVTDGQVVLELVNADAPEDRIVSTWPVVPGDKGYAYSVKFPLVRLFLIGDGEENDEAEMAEQSAAATTRTASARPAAGPPPRNPSAALNGPPRASGRPTLKGTVPVIDPVTDRQRSCPTCTEGGMVTVELMDGRKWRRCSRYPDCKWTGNFRDQLDTTPLSDEEKALAAAAPATDEAFPGF